MNNDLISRAALREAVLKRDPEPFKYEIDFQSGLENMLENVLEDIESAPAVDAEPVRHGYWIPQDNTFTRYMCSECKGKNHGGHEKFCPECGAKMDKAKAGE